MLDALDEVAPLSNVGGDDFLSQFDEVLNPAAVQPDAVQPDATEPEVQQPAADETQPEVENDGLDDIPEELSGKASVAAKENFKKLRESATRYKKEASEIRSELTKREEALAAREARIAELEKSVARMPELEEKTKYVEEAERELAVARVEGTQEYKNTIEKPLSAIADAAEAIAKSNDIEFETLISVLGERDPAKRREGLRDILGGVDEVDKQELIRMAQDTQQILTKRDEIRERAAEARKELEERTRENESKAQTQAREAFESASKKVMEDLKARIPFVSLDEGETADAVFAIFAEKVAKANLDAADPRTKAFAAASGVLLPRVVKQLRAVQTELETYKQRVKDQTSASPKVGSGTPATRRAGRDAMDEISELLGVTNPGSGNPLDHLG